MLNAKHLTMAISVLFAGLLYANEAHFQFNSNSHFNFGHSGIWLLEYRKMVEHYAHMVWRLRMCFFSTFIPQYQHQIEN